MSFNQQSWGRVSVGANTNPYTLQNGVMVGSPAIYSYISSTDSQATISAANYFSGVVADLSLGDFIYVVDSTNTPNTYYVSSLDLAGRTVSITAQTSSGILTVPNGGTGVATMTTAYGVICAGTTATGALQNAGTGTAGQALVSNGAAALPTWQSVASSAWNVQTTTPVTMSANNSYAANNAGLITFNLPAICSFGDIFELTGKGAGGWLIRAAGGQTINLGSSATSVGGSLASTNRYDSISIVCITANTTFNVMSCMGNITVA